MRRRTDHPFRGAGSCPPARCPSGSARCARGSSPVSGNMCRASSLPPHFRFRQSRRPGGSMHEKGPPVYLDYDQAALDAAYDQAAYAPNREQLIKRRIRDSELTRLRIGEPERVPYGQAEIERLDIYRTKRDAAPVFVFIHGGAWRSGRSKDFATPAEMFLAAGVHYVVPDFAWVQDVGGSLMVLADQVRRAIYTAMLSVSASTRPGSMSAGNPQAGTSLRSH